MILLASVLENQEEWRQAFLSADKDLPLVCYGDEGVDLTQAEFAIIAKPPAGVLENIPNLRAIFSLWAGVEASVRVEGFPLHIPLYRMVDDNMALAITEYIIGRILVDHLSIPRFMRQHSEKIWDDNFQPRLAHEQCVGIAGAGNIGKIAAEKLSGLGFRVRCWSRSPKSLEHAESFHGQDLLADFLSECDYLVSLLPATKATEDIFDAQVFNACKRGCYFINVGRGGQVVEADLLAALDDGVLSGACLDVFRKEPLPSEHSFWTHPKIALTPHIAGVTPRHSGVRHILGLIDRIRRGETPEIGLYNPAKGY